MNISIFMAVWCQNLWDELILKNEINSLREKYKDFSPQFQVFTYDIKNIFYLAWDIEYFEYFPINIKNPKNIFRNLKNLFNFLFVIKKSDLVVFGGWGIFFDSEVGNATNPLNQWFYRAKIAKFFRKKLMTYAVSLEVKREESTEKIQKIFSLVDEAFVRDEKSQNYLANLWIQSEIISDPVFWDNGKTPEENQKISYLQESIKTSDFQVSDIYKYNFENKIVWLALRSGFLKDEEVMIKNIVNFITQSWWKVIFLPHSFHLTDETANDKVFLEKFLVQNAFLKKNMLEVYEVYQKKHIDFCISMRLHSMILSQVYEIPFVSLQYSQKTEIFTK